MPDGPSHNSIRLALGFIILHLLARPTEAQQPVDFSPVERLAIQELRETNTPGAAIAVVRDGKVMFVKGFGVANIETGEPVTPDMLFVLGSTTKMFTAAALLMLAEQGRLRLDDSIGTFLPGLRPKVARLTARQLLSNTAGLSDGFGSVGPADDSALVRAARSLGDDYVFLEPGTLFSYSNPGFILAGALIEAVSRKPYAAVIDDLLLTPLGMSHSTFDPSVAMTYPRSQGHAARGHERPSVVRPVVFHPGGWPAGSLEANVSGMARFAIALMDSGRIDGRQVIPANVVAAMSQSHSQPIFPFYTVVSFTFENMTYGFGSILYDVRGAHVVGHNGDVAGFGSVFRTVPAHKVAVVALANRSGIWLNRTVEKAMELLLPLTPSPATPARPLAMSEREIAEYAGRYTAPRRTPVELRVDRGRLLLQGAQPMVVVKIGELRFRAVSAGGGEGRSATIPEADPTGDTPPEFVLLRDSQGRIGYLHMQARAMRRESRTGRP